MKKIVFIILFVLLVSTVSAAKFDAQIENELEKEDYVDIIIKLKDKRGFSAQDNIANDVTKTIPKNTISRFVSLLNVSQYRPAILIKCRQFSSPEVV